MKGLGCENECSSSTCQRMPGNVFQEYRLQKKGRFRYTNRGLFGTHFLDDDKISDVSKYRFSFMTTSGLRLTLSVWFGEILHLKRHGITISHRSHLPRSTRCLSQYVVYTRCFMHTAMSSPATSNIY